MTIISIEPLKSKKNRITFDDDTIIYLYNSEIKKLKLDIGSVITMDEFDKINSEIIFARAKKKALAILDKSFNSIEQIRTKLRRADYNDDIINKVICFLEEYKLVDDEAYAKMYVASNAKKKSTLELKCELKKRGIDRNIISQIFEEYDCENEIVAIRKYVSKYQDSDGNIPKEKYNKIKASLYRRGYKLDNILKVLDISED